MVRFKSVKKIIQNQAVTDALVSKLINKLNTYDPFTSKITSRKNDYLKLYNNLEREKESKKNRVCLYRNSQMPAAISHQRIITRDE